MNPFLSLQNISCGYKKSFHLKAVSFGLEKGMFAGIIGPNGSGKTTLFKGIAGDLKVKKGNLLLNHEDLSLMSLKKKAQKVAVVTQFVESVEMTVEEYVLMGRIPYRKGFPFIESVEDVAWAHKYMKLTQVFHMRGIKMSQLSGGEQQLAGIARALTQKPDLLLLDEPTSHLDISHQVQILNLIQNLSHDLKLTVLMIIHDLNLAGEYCDYLMMMKEGELYKKGTPEEVLNYKDIEDVYGTVVITQTNPLSNKPAIFLVSDKILKDNKLER